MATNVKQIAKLLNAEVVGEVPDVGGGAFGAARLTAALRDRLAPSRGVRPGRPTDARWVHRPKVPMTEDTIQRLAELADGMSSTERKVSPMQVAAQVLEDALTEL